MQVNCVIVRGPVATEGAPAGARETGGEAFVIDSPILPDELDALTALLEQARFPAPSGLLATHADWDHLLGRLAFPGLALGCAESTAERLASSPGEAQRELRAFDEGLLIERDRPLALGSVQALPVPGRCLLGEHELELHPAGGHTPDGMAVLIPWAHVLLAGDYLSPVELPTFSEGGISTHIWRRSIGYARSPPMPSTWCPAMDRCWTGRAHSRCSKRTRATCERWPSMMGRPSCRRDAAVAPSGASTARMSRPSGASRRLRS